MGLFGLLRNRLKIGRASDLKLREKTAGMIAALRSANSALSLSKAKEDRMVEDAFKHLILLENRLAEHDRLLELTSPNDQHRLAILQAQFGDVQEIRALIEQLKEEIQNYNELRMRMIESETALVIAKAEEIEKLESQRLAEIPEESEKVKQVLRSMGG